MKLILCPLAIEFEALKNALGSAWEPRQVGKLKVWMNADFILAIGGHGKVQFALTTQFLIRELNPTLVICAGACGALESGPELMDVVAAKFTVEHDYNLKFIKRPLPKFAGDPKALAKLRQVTACKIHFGTVASGDEDIIDEVRSKELQVRTSALAVAWEGAGGAKAAAFCEVPFLELRTVTDSANQHAPKDFQANVSLGMANIALALNELRDF